ncbi:Iron-sulfur cluster carrier protein [compost metagenome]
MGQIIAVVSQKGGVMKSGLSTALAAAYAQSGWVTEIADMDVDQGTSTGRLSKRLRNGYDPLFTVRQFGNVSQALSKAAACDLMIFDGAPHATKATAAMAKAADLVLIPTGPSLDDMEPAVTLANQLHDVDGVPAERIRFVLALTNSSAAEIADAHTYLNKTRFGSIAGDVPKKAGFSRAHDLGLTLIECPYPSLREQARTVVGNVITYLSGLGPK